MAPKRERLHRVLLIEDDPDDRALAERELRPLPDVELVVAADQAALEQQLSGRPVAVVVTDFELRWTDGFRILEQVRASSPTAGAVLFTLGGDEELALEALRRGFDDFVAKSMPHRLRLQPTVSALIRRHQERAARIQAELQLHQAQKMEAVGRLAGGIAHDFNNLLTAITGHVQLLLHQVSDDSALRPDLEEIDKAAHRATGLTRQLLAFSRKQVMTPRPVDLHGVIGELEKMLRRLIGEHVQLRIRLGAQPSTVMADGAQLEQVLMNLAVNARDAMPDGGELTIATQTTRIDEGDGRLPTGEYVLLEVSDTGHGIDQEALPYIFDPFFTTKELGRGTGLGLSTVHGIVTQSKGLIEVSTAAQGTTFYVFLPLTYEQPEEVKLTSARLDPIEERHTVLVVEDEDAVRALTRKVLEKAGYHVLAARDGLEALALSRSLEAPIDLLLTDVVMPGMNGRDLVNVLRKERPDTRILFMSGYSADAITRHGVLDPGTLLLEKPFTPEVLARRVRDALRGEPTPQP